VEENAVFCPSCGAAQIRVTAPTANPGVADAQPEMATPTLDVDYRPTRSTSGIQWPLFVRTALPWAALTGFISSLFFPIVLLALPLNFRRVLVQYRLFHPGPLGSGTGARLGSAMALLSFVFFVPFFGLTVYLSHDGLITRLRDMAAQNPDPHAQQLLLWCTTNAGFIVISTLVLGFFLLLFLFVGLMSGALMTGEPKNRP
jgi:hypothetical protein